jgi:hypothetical protein
MRSICSRGPVTVADAGVLGLSRENERLEILCSEDFAQNDKPFYWNTPQNADSPRHPSSHADCREPQTVVAGPVKRIGFSKKCHSVKM